LIDSGTIREGLLGFLYGNRSGPTIARRDALRDAWDARDGQLNPTPRRNPRFVPEAQYAANSQTCKAALTKFCGIAQNEPISSRASIVLLRRSGIDSSQIAFRIESCDKKHVSSFLTQRSQSNSLNSVVASWTRALKTALKKFSALSARSLRLCVKKVPSG
jgi:hypothetical protein